MIKHGIHHFKPDDVIDWVDPNSNKVIEDAIDIWLWKKWNEKVSNTRKYTKNAVNSLLAA